MAAGDRWKCDAAEFLCLHPIPGGSGGENANEYSLCVYVVFEEKEQPEMTVLFTGDVEGEGEKELVEELRRYGICDVTLLKTAHHGSRNSTSEELLEQIKPCVAVISCGENNRYGHPHAETVDRLKEAGCRIFTTSAYGAISVESGICEGETARGWRDGECGNAHCDYLIRRQGGSGDQCVGTRLCPIEGVVGILLCD